MSAPAAVPAQLTQAKSTGSLCFVCISGDWDRLYAAFALGGAALALGMQVDFFLAFFGAASLRAAPKNAEPTGWQERLINRMLPRSIDDVPMSRFHYLGLGRWFMRRLLKKNGVHALSKLVADVEELGGQIHYCESSLKLMGLGANQLLPGAGICGSTEVLTRSRGGQICIV